MTNLVKVLIIAMFVISTLFVLFSHTASATDTDFSYRKLITINSSQVDADLLNFPVLLSNTSDDFKDTNNGGHIQPDGDDIEFWSYDLTTEYPYEIDEYDGTTGQIIIWVNVSRVSSTTDTKFWMYYGDTDATSNENPEGVWDSNYLAVYHFTGADWDEILDSTSNGLDATGDAGSPNYNQNAKVGNGVNFVRTSDEKLYLGDKNAFTFSNGVDTDYEFSFECIIKKDVALTGDPILTKYSDDYLREWRLQIASSDKLYVDVYDENYNWAVNRYSSSTVNAGVYYFIGATYDASGVYTGLKLYLNETDVSDTGSTGSGYICMRNTNAMTTYAWMDGPSAGYFFDGIIDEFRISVNTVRNASWMSASSNTMLNDDFVSYEQETVGTTTLQPSSVEENSARLRGVQNTGEGVCDVGFWFGNETTSQALIDSGYGTNISLETPVVEGNIFTKLQGVLSSGRYYYYRAWARNASSNYWNFSANESYFLTKPLPPSSFTVLDVNSTNISLSWTKPTVYVANNTTLIRYKEGSAPSTPTDGYLGYNGSASSCTITGLDIRTAYYFSAWSYINASGSPYLYRFCDYPVTISESTEGGLYNVSVRWECNQSLVANNSEFNNSTIRFEDRTGRLILIDYSFTTNPFEISVDFGVDIVTFYYNNGSVTRKLIPTGDTLNLTFYICCYNTTSIININDDNASDFQFEYTFVILDKLVNSVFETDPFSYLTIYKYNIDGRYNITQDYLSASNDVKVFLHYGERYWIGIRNDEYNIDLIQYVDLSYEPDIDIIIEYLSDTTYPLSDYIDIDVEWFDAGMYINVTDTTYETTKIEMSIYKIFYTNNTEIFIIEKTYYASTASYYFDEVDGCNTSSSYLIEVNITYPGYTEETFSFPVTALTEFVKLVTNLDWLNVLFVNVLGDCPLSPLQWTDTIAFVISVMFLIIFAVKQYGEVSLLASGGILISLEAVFGIITVALSGLAISVGIIMIILGIIFMYGRSG